MTATAITEDYLLSLDGFVTWCELWEADKRCHFAFPDWLHDRELNDAADVAAWAHGEWREGTTLGRHNGYFRPVRSESSVVEYSFVALDSLKNHCDYLSPTVATEELQNDFIVIFPTFAAAIAWLLTKVNPKKLPK